MQNYKQSLQITKLNNSKGFSLIEVIIALTVLVIVGFIGAMLLREGVKTSDAGKAMLDADSQARNVFMRMSREIPMVLSTNAISDFTQNKFKFTDANGLVVQYELSNNQLLQSENNGTAQVLAEGIAAPNFGNNKFFTYLKSDGSTEATLKSDIRYVQVSMTVIHKGTSRDFTTTFYLRNAP